LFYAAGSYCIAQSVTLDENEERPAPRKVVIPYAFYTEALELAGGIGNGVSGDMQPQTKMFATAFVTTNKSSALFFSLVDYQLPFAPRIFVEFAGSFAYYTDQRRYTGFSDQYPGEHAGSNDSNDDNFLQGEGKDYWYDLKFKYLLPVGHGKDTLVNTYRVKNGLLVDGKTGGDIWNPLKSGISSLQLSYFDRYLTIVGDSGENIGDSNGLIAALEYDNRDFVTNPEKGSLQKFTVKKDFGINSSDDWTVYQLDLRKYYSLARTRNFRQIVLALNYWTSFTSSWNVETGNNGLYIDGRPPNELGSSLGGFYRLRAYPVDRFSDKAAIYYSAELRMIPVSNPLAAVKILKPMDIDWWMIVPFIEIGRVAPHWSFSELHQDMRTVLGLGLRMMAQKAVFRLDTGISSDSWSMYAMVGHPF